MSARLPGFRRHHQRGAITIMVTGFIMLALVAIVLVVDSGRLYLEKRKLQRVADMAAIEAVARSGACNVTPSTAQTYATEGAARNGFSVSAQATLTAECGGIASVSGTRQISLDANNNRAIRVRVTRDVPASLMAGGLFGGTVTLVATAVATKGVPLAALTLRSTLTGIDTANSPLLNPLLGGLLGGGAGVNVLSWDGLLTTQISLFDFLDALKVKLNLTAGGYDQVLGTNASVGQIIEAAIAALPAGGGSSAAITALNAIKAGANLAPTTLRLGDLLGFQTGTPVAGADLNMNVFDLVFATAQLANHENALGASIPISLPLGVGTTTLKVKVIEPPRISAIGNPVLAKANPTGPNKIYVRTAQTRLLLSTSLPGLGSLTGVTSAVTNLLSPVTSLLQNVFSNLFCLVICTKSTQTRAVLFPGNPVRVDLGLDLGGSEAWVTDYNCNAGSKSLTATGKTYLSKLLVGQINEASFFSVTSPGSESMTPVPILDVEKSTCDVMSLGICISGWGAWSLWTRTGLMADTGVGESAYPSHAYSNPPEIGAAPGYYPFSSTDLVASLSDTLSGLQLKTYQYDSGQPNGFGAVVGLLDLTVSATSTLAKAVIDNLLAPRLDPLVNGLLKALGIDLAKTEVGHNLSCGSLSGVSLIY